MNTATKISLLIAAGLILLGTIICIIFAVSGNGLLRPGTAESFSKTYPVETAFSSISVNSAACDIRLLPAEDGNCRVECTETEGHTHTVTVKNGTLTVQCTDSKKFLGFISLSSPKQSITLYLPSAAYEAISLKTASGDISVPSALQCTSADLASASGDISFAAQTTDRLIIQSVSGNQTVSGVAAPVMRLEATSGNISLQAVETAGTLTIHTVSGDQSLNQVRCRELTAESTSGDISLTQSDAETLTLHAVSGSITGSLLTPKVYKTETMSGNVSVPQQQTGGSCHISTVSGDIRFQ